MNGSVTSESDEPISKEHTSSVARILCARQIIIELTIWKQIWLCLVCHIESLTDWRDRTEIDEHGQLTNPLMKRGCIW